MLYVLRDCDNRQRALAVYDLRTQLREEFQDIRNNDRLQKFLWDFISQQADRLDTDVYLEPAGEVVKKSHKKKVVGGGTSSKQVKTSAESVQKKKAQKRAVDDDDSYKQVKTSPKKRPRKSA